MKLRCPSDVKIGDIIVRARNKYLAQQHKPAVQKLRDAILSNTDIMGTLNTPLAPIVNTLTGLKSDKICVGKSIENQPSSYITKIFLWYVPQLVHEEDVGKPTKIRT